MTKQITGEDFKNMIINAATAIENNRQEINELNVFPVPDGDTGTNMSLTIGAAEKAVKDMKPFETIGNVAETAAAAMLRGARGNSGVILSLLFRGLSRKLKDIETADSKDFSSALAAGVESAYKAVMKPAEGTILTVSRLAADAATKAAETEDDIEPVLEKAYEQGLIALADTINQNPVLKKAGVIDAGGKGYMYILDGMLKAARGEMLMKTAYTVPVTTADFSEFSTEDILFAYCTEFIVEKTLRNDVYTLRDFLDSIGDSVVLVDDDEIIKAHVHTNDPGVVLTEALTFGAILSVKIENMHEQHSDTLKSNEIQTQTTVPLEEMKEFGFVAVCAGAGIEEVFRDLGTDRLITGGQTMNPSTDDILEKINETPSNTVFVLPNNKNILMAANQCIPLTEKRVIVIPTKSIPQGVSALLAIDDATDIDEISDIMTEAASRVRTALITKAVRDSNYDDLDIKEGELIAMLDDVLIAGGTDIDSIVLAITGKFTEFSPEFITIYAGEGISEAEAVIVESRIKSLTPTADTALIFGDQPVYHYIIAAE